MSIVGEERKAFILRLLTRDGKVRTNDLVERFEVSSETVRRYLEELEAENKLKRVYGGAVQVTYENEEPPYYTREVLRIEEKKRIGQAAAELVCDGDILVIDDGTTTQQMICHLAGKKNLTVLTASFPILSLLMNEVNNGSFSGELFFIGGRVNARHFRTAGSFAERMIEQFYVDKAFVVSDGISLERGITSYDADRGLLAQMFLKNASQTIVLGDHSKLGVSNFYKLADIQDVDIIICDQECPEEWTEVIAESDTVWKTAP